jgi:hypothetical protein
MVDFLARNGTYLAPFLIVAASFLLVAFVIAHKLFVIFKIRNTPLTPTDAFRQHESQTQPNKSARPRLTSVGRIAVIFAVLMGPVAAGLTYATFHKFEVDDRFAKEGQTITATFLSASESRADQIVQYEFQIDGQTYRGSAIVRKLRSIRDARKSKEIDVRYLPSDPTINRPAAETNLRVVIGLLPLALLALCVGIPARQVRRDFVLAKIGRLTTGIAVGVLPQPHGTWIYYDFLNDRGDVTRGNSPLMIPYCLKVVLGSSVQVLYLPGHPERNALKLSMCWQT